jgi:hypothetical protein
LKKDKAYRRVGDGKSRMSTKLWIENFWLFVV